MYYMTFIRSVVPQLPDVSLIRRHTDGFLFRVIAVFRLELTAPLHQLCNGGSLSLIFSSLLCADLVFLFPFWNKSSASEVEEGLY